MTKRNSTANVGADAYENGAGGGGGGVQSVNQGPGVTVNNGDPSNPVVSANIQAGANISINQIGNALQIEANAVSNINPWIGTAINNANPLTPVIAALGNMVEWAAGTLSPAENQTAARFTGPNAAGLTLENWKEANQLLYPLANRSKEFWIINDGAAEILVYAKVGDTFNGNPNFTVPAGQIAFCIYRGTAWNYGFIPKTVNADQLVKTDLADQTADYLFPKLVAGGGINLSVVSLGPSYRAVLIASTDVATGFPNGQQLYEFATNEAEAAIKRDGNLTPPSAAGDNSGTRGFGFVADRTMNVAAARVWISQVGGSNMRLGLYNSAGNRIAQTNRFSPAVGIVQAAFTAPVVLTGGLLYYMALWCDDTTSNLRFLVINGRSTTTTSPLMQRHDPNEMPASIASGLSNTSGRPWLMITE